MAVAYTAVDVTYIPKGGTPAQVNARLDAAITALDTVKILAILDAGEGWHLIVGTSA